MNTRPTADLGEDGEMVERAIALREECRKGVEDRGVMPDYVDACVALNALAPKLLDRLILYREALGDAFGTLHYIYETTDDDHEKRAAAEARDKIDALLSRSGH